VRDTSLRVPPGVSGIVISARVFARKGTEKDDRTRDIEEAERQKFEKDMSDEIKIVREAAFQRVSKILVGAKTNAKVVGTKGKELIGKGATITAELLATVPRKLLGEIDVGKRTEEVKQIQDELEAQVTAIEELYQEKIGKVTKGDELPPGVIKLVKVYVAIKRKLQVGDKMAGRHGNKGVVSRILPAEDMPYLPDGTPVDLVLNPLGVPSRMNVGQVLEVHFGWAGWLLGHQLQRYAEDRGFTTDGMRKKLAAIFAKGETRKLLDELPDNDLAAFAEAFRHGVHFATPVFDGASEDEITRLLDVAGVDQSGQTVLFDGRTGEAFDEDVTVGIMYMLKLHHLVDDKIHARSIGPYSLVTQQPLGGKAQFGGQRLGEMEVWALEAYGAAYALQEFLTVKSDDVQGRTRMYEAIVKGDQTLEAGLPESFNVLMKELQALCLNVELIDAGSPGGMRKADDVIAAEED
jgi:DNA-directed RNA polymerase subunit beta